MTPTVLLNLDGGEHDDEPEELYALADIVHVACGGHAGDEASMNRVVAACVRHGTRVGAHPSYIDREGFGRRPRVVTSETLAQEIADQCAALQAIAQRHGIEITSVKPHGALYHAAHADEGIAKACIDGFARGLSVAKGAESIAITIVGLSGGALETCAKAASFTYLRESFADRGVRADGSLIPRGEPGASIDDPKAAAKRARELATDGSSETICVHADTPASLEIVRAVRKALRATIIRVVYDGEDLDSVASAIGIHRDEVIRLHSEADYEVAMLGFLPGFAYLRGLDAKLQLPRRAPRVRVPANSVGIAADYTGVYPFESPGGWHLLGRAVGFVGFDENGARLHAGDHVRFIPIDAAEAAKHPATIPGVSTTTTTSAAPHLRVVRAAGYATLVDGGRPGHRHEGVPSSGALVRSALARANRHVGNDALAAAALEVTGTFELMASGGAITVATDDTTVAPRTLADGERFVVTTVGQNTRVRYLAVAHGFDGPMVLKSRSPLPVLGLGKPLRRDDRLVVLEREGSRSPIVATLEDEDDDGLIHLLRGPDERVVEDLARLFDRDFRISSVCDRTGTRLDADYTLPTIEHRGASTPMVVGAIELTPSGLIVIGPDGPTTGGYPVVATVRRPSLDRLFSRPIGTSVRFVLDEK